MNSTKPLIRFDQVSVVANDKSLLSDISFALRAGEKAVLRGKSGSGKTSVLKTLMGLHPITGGTVYFQEQALSPASVRGIRGHAAYIGQEPILGADTVREALLLPFKFKVHRQQLPVEAQLLEVLQRLKLPAQILDRECSRISGGEKQRIALARGLLLAKSVYLLDEVTSALDPESKQAVFAVFDDPRLTVLSVAHDPEWLERGATVLEMEAGQLTEVKNGNA